MTDAFWTNVVRQSAQDLMRSDADAFAVRRRLEALVDRYRRLICDPVKLFSSSLRVQEVVAQHTARLGPDVHCMYIAYP